MGKKLKGKSDNNKISREELRVKTVSCPALQDSNLLFEFNHITDAKKYSFDALLEQSKNDHNVLRDFLKLLKDISSCDLLELTRRRRSNIGGYEKLDAGYMNSPIYSKYDPKMSLDTKLFVFRFGSKDMYRMVCHKSNQCNGILHILAFDLHHNLSKTPAEYSHLYRW